MLTVVCVLFEIPILARHIHTAALTARTCGSLEYIRTIVAIENNVIV